MMVSRKWHLVIAIIASSLVLPTPVSTKCATKPRHVEEKTEPSNLVQPPTRCYCTKNNVDSSTNSHVEDVKYIEAKDLLRVLKPLGVPTNELEKDANDPSNYHLVVRLENASTVEETSSGANRTWLRVCLLVDRYRPSPPGAYTQQDPVIPGDGSTLTPGWSTIEGSVDNGTEEHPDVSEITADPDYEETPSIPPTMTTLGPPISDDEHEEQHNESDINETTPDISFEIISDFEPNSSESDSLVLGNGHEGNRNEPDRNDTTSDSDYEATPSIPPTMTPVGPPTSEGDKGNQSQFDRNDTTPDIGVEKTLSIPTTIPSGGPPISDDEHEEQHNESDINETTPDISVDIISDFQPNSLESDSLVLGNGHEGNRNEPDRNDTTSDSDYEAAPSIPPTMTPVGPPTSEGDKGNQSQFDRNDTTPDIGVEKTLSIPTTIPSGGPPISDDEHEEQHNESDINETTPDISVDIISDFQPNSLESDSLVLGNGHEGNRNEPDRNDTTSDSDYEAAPSIPPTMTPVGPPTSEGDKGNQSQFDRNDTTHDPDYEETPSIPPTMTTLGPPISDDEHEEQHNESDINETTPDISFEIISDFQPNSSESDSLVLGNGHEGNRNEPDRNDTTSDSDYEATPSIPPTMTPVGPPTSEGDKGNQSQFDRNDTTHDPDYEKTLSIPTTIPSGGPPISDDEHEEQHNESDINETTPDISVDIISDFQPNSSESDSLVLGNGHEGNRNEPDRNDTTSDSGYEATPSIPPTMTPFGPPTSEGDKGNQSQFDRNDTTHDPDYEKTLSIPTTIPSGGPPISDDEHEEQHNESDINETTPDISADIISDFQPNSSESDSLVLGNGHEGNRNEPDRNDTTSDSGYEATPSIPPTMTPVGPPTSEGDKGNQSQFDRNDTTHDPDYEKTLSIPTTIPSGGPPISDDEHEEQHNESDINETTPDISVDIISDFQPNSSESDSLVLGNGHEGNRNEPDRNDTTSDSGYEATPSIPPTMTPVGPPTSEGDKGNQSQFDRNDTTHDPDYEKTLSIPTTIPSGGPPISDDEHEEQHNESDINETTPDISVDIISDFQPNSSESDSLVLGNGHEGNRNEPDRNDTTSDSGYEATPSIPPTMTPVGPPTSEGDKGNQSQSDRNDTTHDPDYEKTLSIPTTIPSGGPPISDDEHEEQHNESDINETTPDISVDIISDFQPNSLESDSLVLGNGHEGNRNEPDRNDATSDSDYEAAPSIPPTMTPVGPPTSEGDKGNQSQFDRNDTTHDSDNEKTLSIPTTIPSGGPPISDDEHEEQHNESDINETIPEISVDIISDFQPNSSESDSLVLGNGHEGNRNEPDRNDTTSDSGYEATPSIPPTMTPVGPPTSEGDKGNQSQFDRNDTTPDTGVEITSDFFPESPGLVTNQSGIQSSTLTSPESPNIDRRLATEGQEKQHNQSDINENTPDPGIESSTSITPAGGLGTVVEKSNQLVVHYHPTNYTPDFITDDLAPALPPLLDPAMNIHVTFKGSNPPSVVALNPENDSVSNDTVILPTIYCMQGPPPVDEKYKSQCNTHMQSYIMNNLLKMFGRDYPRVLLGKGWHRYDTLISYLISIINAAVKNPKVEADKKLLASMMEYKDAMEFAAPYIFAPMTPHYQKIQVSTTYMTYDSKHPNRCHMDSTVRKSNKTDYVTFPLKNPKIWLQPVNVNDPYSEFTPILPEGSPYFARIQLLSEILQVSKIHELLGPDWNVAVYPNRGMLFICLLRRLVKLHKLTEEQHTLIYEYLEGIQNVGLHTHISRRYISNLFKNHNGAWRIDVRNLINVLPTPTTDEETRYSSTLVMWLEEKHFLQNIGFKVTTSTISHYQLFTEIIEMELSTEIESKDLKAALMYYRSRILTTGFAVTNVIWVWETIVTVTKFEKIYADCLRYNELNPGEQSAYVNVLKYLKANIQFITYLSFEVDHYSVYSDLLRRMFNSYEENPSIDKEIMENIRLLSPKIHDGGPGSTPVLDR